MKRRPHTPNGWNGAVLLALWHVKATRPLYAMVWMSIVGAELTLGQVQYVWASKWMVLCPATTTIDDRGMCIHMS